VAVKDGSVAVIDASNRTMVRRLTNPGPVVAVSFSPDGVLLATATAEPDSAVRVWKLSPAQNDPICAYCESAPINAIAFSPNQSLLAIAPGTQIAFTVDPAPDRKTGACPTPSPARSSTAPTAPYSSPPPTTPPKSSPPADGKSMARSRAQQAIAEGQNRSAGT
jgi:WD40 repeat protein